VTRNFRLSAEAAKASAEAAVLTARAAGDRAIATMRLQWAQDLPKILSENHSVLVSYGPRIIERFRSFSSI
jgi:hypothetical protein